MTETIKEGELIVFLVQLMWYQFNSSLTQWHLPVVNDIIDMFCFNKGI